MAAHRGWLKKPTLEDRLEALAADVGRLRKGTRDTQFDWHVDRIADALEDILFEYWSVTASDLVHAGFTPEEALRDVDRRCLRLRKMLAVPERSLRLAGLI